MVQVFYPDEKTEVQDFKFIDGIRLHTNKSLSVMKQGKRREEWSGVVLLKSIIWAF